MKESVVIFVLCVMSLGASVAAQDFPRVKVFGGYQYTRIGVVPGINTNGWNTAVGADLNRWLGVKADFSGAYKSAGGISAKAHTYTFGPVLSHRGERVTPVRSRTVRRFPCVNWIRRSGGFHERVRDDGGRWAPMPGSRGACPCGCFSSTGSHGVPKA